MEIFCTLQWEFIDILKEAIPGAKPVFSLHLLRTDDLIV